MEDKTKVLFVGKAWFTLKMHIKGFDMVPFGGYEDFGVWFVDAMSKYEDIEVLHMPNHIAVTSFPKTPEEIEKYDVVILSDCGKNTLYLYPDMFVVPMGPDRLTLIKEFVNKGNAFIMTGGYLSYQGIRESAGYHDTPIEEILPVDISPHDDRAETPQGCMPEILKADHPIFKNLKKEWPKFLGHSKVKAKKEADLLAKINDDPFIVTWDYGKGRTMAFTSDITKHWGTAFIDWESYGDFWHNALRWLSRKL